MKEYIISVLVMAGVTYLIRMLPLTFFTRKITNIYIRSFMEYVPCVVLACMTFPAVFHCCENPLASICGSVAAIGLGYQRKSLVSVAVIAAGVVFVVSYFMNSMI